MYDDVSFVVCDAVMVNNSFLNKLKGDTEHISNEPNLLIAADKTTNFYKVEPSAYNDLLEQNITGSYKKAHLIHTYIHKLYFTSDCK